MKTFYLAAALSVLMLTMQTSCEKDENLDSFVGFSEDEDEISSYYADILAEADDVTMREGEKSGMDSGNPVGSGTRNIETTFSGDTMIHTITYVDFVNGNSHFERVKNGVVYIKVLGRPFQAVYKRMISFYNFTIDNNHVEGLHVIEKTSDYQYAVTITGGKISFTDGTYFTRNLSQTRTWVSGYNTPFQVWDDEFTIDGNVNGMTRKGKTYSNTITTPLLIKNNCRWIVQGVIEINIDNKTASLDYGEGTCDRLATVTVNGNTFNIRLRGGS